MGVSLPMPAFLIWVGKLIKNCNTFGIIIHIIVSNVDVINKSYPRE